MKIITRGVISWETGAILEEDSFEYSGPLALGKDSGSAPTPTDPYAQAGAQYGLDTGTANYNARLNRTDSSNALGSNNWNIVGYDGGGATGIPGTNSGAAYGMGGTPTGSNMNPAVNPGGIGPYGGSYGFTPNHGVPTGMFAQATGGVTPGYGGAFALGGGSMGGVGVGGGTGGTGAPIYSQRTTLQPWAESMLEHPIDTQGIAGMPGGPSTTQDLYGTRSALLDQQMAYLRPQQALAGEQLDSKLANEGITPGSEAYKQALDQQNRENTFTNNQAIDSAITGGGQEQSRLFGLGSQSLQNQLALRSAPIQEYEALQGNAGANSSAATPDISGAFNQQYQGQLAGYNADTATNNANTSGAASVAMMAALYF